MAKFFIVPAIIILGLASIFYVTSVKAKENNRELQKQKIINAITKITIVDYKIPPASASPVSISSKDLKSNDKDEQDQKEKDKKNAKSDDKNSQNNSQNQCYAYIATSAKLASIQDVTLNFNNSNLDSSGFIVDTATSAINEWNTKEGKTVFGNVVTDSSAAINDTQADGKNVIAFVNNPDTNIVSTINLWGHFSNRPGGGVNDITEWDIALNSANIWGDATKNVNAQDLQNAITHALGHAAGMADLSSATCSKETMFDTLPVGETQKRDLGPGDIKGIQTLYK